MPRNPDEKWGGYNTVDYQLCYTDEGVFYNVKDDIIERTENALAAGSVIGKDLKSVDVSQGDNGDYCRCTECMKVFKEEGGAMSGCVVRWANRLEEEISAEEGGKYDGLVYLIFAYMGTQPHCRTAPNENVYLTFAMTAPAPRTAQQPQMHIARPAWPCHGAADNKQRQLRRMDEGLVRSFGQHLHLVLRT